MFQELLDTTTYAPHGFCLLWDPWLVGLHITADVLIFLSYTSIPIALLLFLRRRPDIQYRGLVALFAAFIVLCGLTHLVSIGTLWVPAYGIQGLLKLLTGLVSAVTAVALFQLIPRLVAIPSPRQLEEANAKLRAEIAAHERTLTQLREAQHLLEVRVEERTRDLSAANAKLSVLSREAVHRGRNLLTVVSSIANQTARTAGDLPGFEDAGPDTAQAVLEEAAVKRAFAGVAARVILAVDSAKLGATASARAFTLEEVDLLVTELEPEDDRLDRYRGAVELA